jgi:hypothetical protein
MGCSIDWALTLQAIKTILDPIAAASWPIGVVTIFWLFRSDLRNILPRIRTIKGAGVEADLHIETQIATSPANQVSSELSAGFGTEYPPPNLVYDELDKISRDILNREIQGDTEKKFAWAIRMRSISEASRIHEMNYRLIFGSQLKALRRLNVLDRAQVSQFEPIFQEAATNPDTAPFHEGRTFEEWGQFLLNTGYVRQVPNTAPLEVEISSFGQQFLVWIVEARASEFRPG